MTKHDYDTVDDGQQAPADKQVTPATSSPSRQRLPIVLAVLALLVALSAAGFSAVSWLVPEEAADDDSGQRLEADLRGQGQRLEQLAGEIGAATERLSRLESDQADLDERLEGLREPLGQARDRAANALQEASRNGEDLVNLAEELQAQMQQLWQREGAQREVDHELERRLLLMEGASLLAFGQARAELGNDFEAARMAYRHARSLVQRADDPRLGQVRRLLAQELDALESVRSPDWLEFQGRIQRQARRVAEWPLIDQETAPTTSAASDADSGGWLASTRDALGGLVRVSPREGLELNDRQVETLREMARLRWLAAELAIGRRDTAELDHHLRGLERLIDDWFRPDAPELEAARRLIEELGQVEAAPIPEALGQALAALRQQLDPA